jgi:hypothetical protein
MQRLKATEANMQFVLTRRNNLFDFTKFASTPNVSHGLWSVTEGHEIDLLAISKKGTLHEVEIKVSRADIKADAKKHGAHQSQVVSFVWLAAPLELEQSALELAPEHFGIVICDLLHWSTRTARRPKRSPHWQRKATPADVEKLLRLGVMRMWSRAKAEPESLD